MHVDNPRQVLRTFARRPGTMLLAAIAHGDEPLSHATLDAHASRAAAEHLRSLLVAAGALPARDEHLHRLQNFIVALLDTVDSRADRQVLSAYSRWHQLVRLRARTTGSITPHAAYHCRTELAAASRFLAFLRDRNHDLARCSQEDIDTWFGPATRHTATVNRTFLAWARRRRHLPVVHLPRQTRAQPVHFRAADQRWDLARRMLHDPAAGPIADRVAACLVLLYAQTPARIVALPPATSATATSRASG